MLSVDNPSAFEGPSSRSIHALIMVHSAGQKNRFTFPKRTVCEVQGHNLVNGVSTSAKSTLPNLSAIALH